MMHGAAKIITKLKEEFKQLTPIGRLVEIDKLRQVYCFACGGEKTSGRCRDCRTNEQLVIKGKYHA